MVSRKDRTIWVVRHGERIDNVDLTWKQHPPRGAWDDPPLSERGLQQARECGKKLANKPIEVVLCSPFWRTVQTANEIVQNHSKPLRIFIEMGICETLNCTQYPPGCLTAHELCANFPTIDTNYQPIVVKSGPEIDIVACKDRLIETIDAALEKYPGEILMVTHGSPAAMINEIFTDKWQYVGQCTISKFVSDQNGKFTAELLGDSAHLSDQTNLRENEYTRPKC